MYICAHVKDPVVHVRVRWIMETLKHPACTLCWIALLCRSWLSPGEGNPNFPWRKFHLDSTVVKTFFKIIKKKLLIFYTFNNCIVPKAFLPREIRVAFPGGKPAATKSRYPIYSACWVLQCFHNPPNYNINNGIFYVRTEVNTCECTRGCTDTVRESALKSDSGRKIPCLTGESNLRWQRARPMLYQLSYIPPQYNNNMNGEWDCYLWFVDLCFSQI